MNRWKCPVCDEENGERPVCTRCGFDETKNCVQYRVPGRLPESVLKGEAAYNLGDCFWIGQGVPEDKEMAVSWYKRAANQGYAEAECTLGDCYFYGDGVPQDFKKAVIWYEKAANQGHVQAAHALGECYFYGYGVPEDKEKAAVWYKKSANQGNVSG